MREAVISGIGLLGPTGNGLQAFWRSLIEGHSGIGRITRFDATSYACQIGGEVRDRSYEQFLDPRTLRTTTHATQLALGAAELAVRDARLPADWYEAGAMGVSVGTALGGWREGEQQYGILLERGARRVNPFIANGAPNHNPGVEVARAFAAEGTQATFSTGCSSSLQAIGHAVALVSTGELEMCIAGGTESPLSPVVVASMGRTQELSTLNDAPDRASCPFDQRHAGLVLSEGGCFMVIESQESAAQRGARIYAKVPGVASSCDAKGVYGSDPTGRPGATAIHKALGRAKLQASEIDYVCAHANSSPAFDRKETVVLKAAFGEFAARIPVSSIKGVLGHPLGASGAFQVAAACLAIERQLIPPTHNLESPDPECDLDYVPRHPRSVQLRNILITSYGYGGVNAYLVISDPRL